MAGGHGPPPPDEHRKWQGEHKPYKTGGYSLEERPPHGGQVTRDFLYFVEVVCLPQETHVYVFGPAQEPILSQHVRGEVVMQPNYLKQAFRLPLKFIGQQSDPGDVNHLTTAVDVSRVRDGEMTVTVKLENLPLRAQTKATVAQTFAMAGRPPQMATVPDANRPGIAR